MSSRGTGRVPVDSRATGPWINAEVDEQTGVGVITLAHPPVNAINRDMADHLREIINCWEGSGIRAAVLTGGPLMFSGGFDVNELRTSTPADAIPRNRNNYRTYRAIEEARFPVVAAINGYAVGGGCELALACDIRVVARDAFFRWPEVDLAGLPHMQRLTRTIGAGMARWLVYTGGKWGAEDACRGGLVDVLCQPAQAIPAAMAICGQIADKPPRVLEACKMAMRIPTGVPLPVAQDAELSLVGLAASDNARQGLLDSFGNGTSEPLRPPDDGDS